MVLEYLWKSFFIQTSLGFWSRKSNKLKKLTASDRSKTPSQNPARVASLADALKKCGEKQLFAVEALLNAFAPQP